MWKPSVCTKDCPDACSLLVTASEDGLSVREAESVVKRVSIYTAPEAKERSSNNGGCATICHTLYSRPHLGNHQIL